MLLKISSSIIGYRQSDKLQFGIDVFAQVNYFYYWLDQQICLTIFFVSALTKMVKFEKFVN